MSKAVQLRQDRWQNRESERRFMFGPEIPLCPSEWCRSSRCGPQDTRNITSKLGAKWVL